MLNSSQYNSDSVEQPLDNVINRGDSERSRHLSKEQRRLQTHSIKPGISFVMLRTLKIIKSSFSFYIHRPPHRTLSTL